MSIAGLIVIVIVDMNSHVALVDKGQRVKRKLYADVTICVRFLSNVQNVNNLANFSASFVRL